MYRLPIETHKRLQRGEVPTPYVLISTGMGYRAYSNRELIGIFDITGGLLADGSVTADGSEVAGSDGVGVLEKSARVLSFGSFDRVMENARKDILGSYVSQQIQSMEIDLDNADGYFAKLIPKEPFIGRPMYVYVGFPDEAQSNHISLFTGTITELSVTDRLTIEAEA